MGTLGTEQGFKGLRIQRMQERVPTISPFPLVSVVALLSRYTQVLGCRSDHATDVRSDTDHLETLTHTRNCGLPVATKDTEGDVVLPGCYFHTFQRFHKFWFSTVAARYEAKLSMKIVRPHECYVNSWNRENLIEIL
jgi:hypothetical protein